MVEGNNEAYFEVDVELSLASRFLKVGDEVVIKYKKNSGYNLVLSLEYKK
jgi:hypothetical protein